MSIYFEQAQPAALLDAYPIGAAFLEGPAALNAGQLHELQEKRFARVIERAWQVPFYQRHWREAGLTPGDIKTLNDLAKVPVFSKKDLMEKTVIRFKNKNHFQFKAFTFTQIWI